MRAAASESLGAPMAALYHATRTTRGVGGFGVFYAIRCCKRARMNARLRTLAFALFAAPSVAWAVACGGAQPEAVCPKPAATAPPSAPIAVAPPTAPAAPTA